MRLTEGIDIKIVYADDTPSEYIDDVTHNDILDIIEESPEVYKIFDVSGSKKKLVWSDEYGFERAYESKKFVRKSLKERKKFQYGEEIIKFLDKYGYNKCGEDFEQKKDYSTVTYMYAIPKGMRPQTPYVEFTVDADNDAFIFGEFFTDGRKGYSTEFDSVEDLEYFVSNANYSNVDLTEKKSVRKSLKEGINDELIATSSDGETALYLSDERQANHGKDPHYEFKLGENGYFTRYIRCDDERCENVVLDWIKEFDLDISKSEISKIIKLHESKKFTRKSMKESTDESFSLYDLNKHDPFIKEWVKNINKELKDVSIESIGDNEIIFRVWFDESIDLDIFDDIATDCMPRTLIEFMSDMNIDFGYQFVYADDKFTENDFVFIRFVAW